MTPPIRKQRKSGEGDVLFGSMTPKQLEDLRRVFARMTPDGWITPPWFDLLEKSVHDNMALAAQANSSN